MVASKIEKRRFDWGDPVKLVPHAPNRYKSIPCGDVVGIDIIDGEVLQKKFSEPFGTIIYTVEGSTGEDLDIPEIYLEKYAG